MMQRSYYVSDLKRTVIVFDLDDTLYFEADYQLSGYKAIQKKIKNLYGIEIPLMLRESSEDNDILSYICKELSLPETVKESLLWFYRLHLPDIKLDEKVKLLLEQLDKSAMAVAILTDGRSVTQRLKLKALGLQHYEVFISEEWQESKPGLKRFNAIAEKYSGASRFLYIGDNVKKDFIAPNALNWLTVGIRDQGRNIHPQNVKLEPPTSLPKVWINNLSELNQILC